MTNKEILLNLVAAGFRWRYGDQPNKWVVLRKLWEMKHIIENGYGNHYLMAFTLFRHNAASAGIGYWARGAVPSSVVCYCLGLTEIDPVKYGLHSVRFVNNEPPKFQFDIEASRFNEFMEIAEEVLQTCAAEGYDIPAIRECLFKDLKPCEYLSRKQERPLPKDLDDEIAREALSRPDTMDLYDAYMRRKSDGLWSRSGTRLDDIVAPTCGFLVYQEQMLDILRQFFHGSSIMDNQIRLSIQRRDAEQVDAYKHELFSDLHDLTEKKAEWLWQILTGNPRAFLKAHAVSRVLAQCKYEIERV